jgi:hypothetical protein
MQPPTESAPPATSAPDALTLLQRLKRLQMIRDPGNMADTILVSQELIQQLLRRVARLEAENSRLRARR